MDCRVADLRCKEVINICTGLRLGCVCDVLFDPECGSIKALVVPGQYKAFGLLGRDDDIVIPWDCIKKVGDDIILIEVSGELRRARKGKKPYFQ